MFKHILIPLDGSLLAEAVLPTGAYLAGVCGSAVTLLHVIEHDAPQEIHGERHLHDAGEAGEYLDEVARRSFPAGMRVERHVHTDGVTDVAAGIALHVGEFAPDLILMCTHGRGGLHGFIFGRIAHQVVKLGSKPVLLIPPHVAGIVPTFSCKRLLVALDGNPAHEDALRVAAGLAQVCTAELQLLMVVPTAGTLSGEEAATAVLLPGATAALLDLAEQEARQYLQRHLSSLQAAGVTVTAVVLRGNPVTDIITAAEQAKTDLIVMATHGKIGIEAFWSRSAAPNVATRTIIPLLLVPVTGHTERGGGGILI
jgi:nucleotide-binding universal stress UspA family protein